MTKELTPTQELILADLTTLGALSISMTQMQLKYSKIASKASIKRDIDKLVEEGIITRTHIKKCENGRITSTTIYSV